MRTLSGARTCTLARHPLAPRAEVEGRLDYSGEVHGASGAHGHCAHIWATVAYAVVAATQTLPRQRESVRKHRRSKLRDAGRTHWDRTRRRLDRRVVHCGATIQHFRPPQQATSGALPNRWADYRAINTPAVCRNGSWLPVQRRRRCRSVAPSIPEHLSDGLRLKTHAPSRVRQEHQEGLSKGRGWCVRYSTGAIEMRNTPPASPAPSDADGLMVDLGKYRHLKVAEPPPPLLRES